MMTDSQRELWVGGVFIVEWDLIDTNGDPIDDATIVGIVVPPNLITAPMTVTHNAGQSTYRMAYQASAPGLHGYHVTASGTGLGAIGGEFIVNTDVVGAPPINVDAGSTIGRVRLLCTDTTDPALFTDSDIAAFVAMEGGNVKLAAALALETMASNEAMVSKKIRSQNIQTDGPAVSDALLKRAKVLREQATDGAIDDDTGETFAAYVVPYDGGYRW